MRTLVLAALALAAASGPATGRSRGPSPSFAEAGYFFLTGAATCLASSAAFFFRASAVALTCFCPAFLLVDLGDLSPMTVASVDS
ncbi:hypothetical protein [Rubrivirga sp.]|uniref:hypothetical protein n=1 Tax=Rubrivirga sp. TaxID=1885344 RepID=UPI003B52A207